MKKERSHHPKLPWCPRLSPSLEATTRLLPRGQFSARLSPALLPTEQPVDIWAAVQKREQVGEKVLASALCPQRPLHVG